MAANYVLIERITVGAAGASSVTFNNIPQTGYTDLLIKTSIRANNSSGSQGWYDSQITFNGISSGYTIKALYGNGSSAASFSDTVIYDDLASSATPNYTFSNSEIYIPNYTSSNAKSISIDSVTENNATSSKAGLYAGLWSYTGNPAINKVTITGLNSSIFQQYSTFSLYALAAVGTTPTKAPKAIGGDIIQTDGTYWYHAFLSSGSFTPQTALSCDVLVVAGGGGASINSAAGGGAGGVLALASQGLAANTTQLVTVGAGGAGSTSTPANGGNSSFGSLSGTVYGGGHGGKRANSAGGNGGSSGGGASDSTSYNLPGTPTSGQGYSGAAGIDGGNYNNGGGGGAGGAARTLSGSSDSTGGTGGAGVNTYTGWGSLSSALTTLGLGVSGYIAGGGGGGSNNISTIAGGSGGGGNGTGLSAGAGGNGVANTGSGAGGTGDGSVSPASGGSGLVIVRYAY